MYDALPTAEDPQFLLPATENVVMFKVSPLPGGHGYAMALRKITLNLTSRDVSLVLTLASMRRYPSMPFIHLPSECVVVMSEMPPELGTLFSLNALDFFEPSEIYFTRYQYSFASFCVLKHLQLKIT